MIFFEVFHSLLRGDLFVFLNLNKFKNLFHNPVAHGTTTPKSLTSPM